MKAIAILTLAVLPFGVCAEQEEKPFRIGECYAAMWSDARASAVAARLGVTQSPVPLALRASKAKANAKERESLDFVSGAQQHCQRLDEPNRARFHPLTRQMIDEFESSYRSILARLYAGDITWGAAIDANDANYASLARRNAELIEIGKANAERLAADKALADAQAEEQRKAALRADFERQQRADAMQRQAEIAQREQSNREIANGLLLLQMARPQPSMNCRSTRFFDTVNTTCN